MQIVLAKFKDIPNAVALLEKANEEFGHPSIPFCKETTRNTLQRVINQRDHEAFLLVDNDGKVRGIMAGLTNQLWYSRKRQIVDLIYYVDGETRGHGGRLLSAFLSWARTVPNVMEISVGITSGIAEIDRLEKLFAASGLTKVGGIYTLHPTDENIEDAA